nr:DUF481 domain-containing protein [Oscillatoria laete-virens]
MPTFFMILTGIFVFCHTISHAAPTPDQSALLQKIKELEKQNAELKKQVSKLSKEKSSPQKKVTATKPDQPVLSDSATASVEPEKKRIWKYNVGLGYTYRTGNDDSQEGNLLADAIRETDKDKLHLGATGLLGTDNQGQQVSKATGRSQYNHDIDQRFYWLVLGNGEYDSAQRLDYRVFAGPGLGWHAIREEKTRLNFESGPTLEFQKFSSQSETSSIKGRLAQNFEYRFNDTARVFQGTEVLGDPTNDNDFLLNARAGVETGVTKNISVRLTLQNQYNSLPLPGTQSNDFSAITSLIFNY